MRFLFEPAVNMFQQFEEELSFAYRTHICHLPALRVVVNNLCVSRLYEDECKRFSLTKQYLELMLVPDIQHKRGSAVNRGSLLMMKEVCRQLGLRYTPESRSAIKAVLNRIANNMFSVH